MAKSTEELLKELVAARKASGEPDRDPEVAQAAALAKSRAMSGALTGATVEGEDTGVDAMDYPAEVDRYNPSPEVQEALRQLMLTGGSSKEGMAGIRLLDEERMSEPVGVEEGSGELEPMMYDEDAELDGDVEMGPTKVEYQSPEENPEEDASYDALQGIGSDKEAEMLEKLKGLKK